MPDITFKSHQAGERPFTVHSEANSDGNGLDDFLGRTETFLEEVQKRLLAEQVSVIVSGEGGEAASCHYLIPHESSPIISPDRLLSLLDKNLPTSEILDLSDIVDQKISLRGEDGSVISSLIITGLDLPDSVRHYLVVFNYSKAAYASRVREFIIGIRPVVSQALINNRLYLELKRRQEAIGKLSGNSENRIEGTSSKMLDQEFQYHALFEGSNDGIVVHLESGVIQEVNEVICALLGYNRQDLIRKKWKELVPAHLYGEQRKIFNDVLLRHPTLPFETRLLKKDGSEIPVEINSKMVWFMGHESIQTTVRDITLREQLQRALRESKEKYRLLIESSLVGVYNIQAGSFLYVNTMFEKITGYSRRELYDLNFFYLVDEKDRERVRDIELRRGAGGDTIKDYETILLHKGGKQIAAEIRSVQIVIDGKKTILGNVIDISRRKEMANRLLEIKKMESISTLAGGIAHDFNNLLGGILGYASLLLSEMKEDDPYYNDIETISKTAQRAAELTERLLAFAQGGKYQEKPLDLNKIVEEVVSILEGTINENVKIISSMDPALWQIKGDGEQIQKAVLNICLNGIEALSDGGKLILDTTNTTVEKGFSGGMTDIPTGEYVRLVIADNGIGMSNEIKARMFEPFFTTKNYGEGAGLGLAMVYGVIKNHNGFILVETQSGLGTTVSIFLPKIIPVIEEHKPASIFKKTTYNRILFVDDEKVIREVSRRMLERGGYEVILAPNGASALKIFMEENRTLDLVLIDWVMPKMGGKETARRMRDINPDVPICFLSGYRPSDKPDLLRLSKNCFIQKPFRTEVLLETIQQILKKPC